MHYLVDGHNLIPKVDGMDLQQPDDEAGLLPLLQEFSRWGRHRVEVYFDGAPPGRAGTRQSGTVKAHFVRKGRTADDAITERLLKLGRAARSCCVVSSDRRVQAEARATGAAVVSSEDFARQLRSTNSAGRSNPGEEKQLNPGDVEKWLNLFDQSGDPK